MMFASTGFPLYIALYGDFPPAFNYVAVLALMALIVVAVIGTVQLTELWRNGGGLVFQPVQTDRSIKNEPSMEEVS
jgi:hypothetical protein